MSYRVDLVGYTPPARYPPAAALVVQARIEEAAAPVDALASVIEGPFVLSPAMTNPSDPVTYSFSTDGGLLDEGWFRVVWIDAQGEEQPTDWIELRRLSPYAPSVGDVAAILRARLVETGGGRVEAFTADTEPTAAEVSNLVAMFAPSVLGQLGDLGDLGCTNASDLRRWARTQIAQRVAIEVELSYRPDEVGVEAANATAERRSALDTDMTALVRAVELCREKAREGGDAGESVGRNDPAWAFPRLPYLNW